MTYTADQFRKHLREAFNAASKGEQVIVDRYGEKFRLVAFEQLDGSIEAARFKAASERKPDIQLLGDKK